MELETLLKIARASKHAEVLLLVEEIEKLYKERGVERMTVSLNPMLLLDKLNIEVAEDGTITYNKNAYKEMFAEGITALIDTLKSVRSVLNNEGTEIFPE